MNRIGKGLAALVAAVFFLGAGGTAQAVIGVPDDVPASTLLYPFFKINPDRSASDQQDTILVVTNTAGATTSGTSGTSAQSGVAPNVAVHFTIWSQTSQHVYDFSIILTPHDVWSCSLFDLLVGGTGCENAFPAPTGVQTSLLATVGGVSTLVGYVTADVVYTTTSLFPGQPGYPFGYGNVLVGHMYLVNLVNGSSTGFNAVSIETDNPCYGQNALPVGAQLSDNTRGFYRTRCEEEQGAAACSPVGVAASCPSGGGSGFAYGDFTERIDGPNGDFAQTGSAGGYAGTFASATDSPLSLILRYFSATNLEARSEVWLWKDRNTSGSAANLNVAVYDEAENVHSVTLNLPNEVNFALTAQIITPGAPGGWFRAKFPCGQFNSCTYNYASPSGASTRPSVPIQAVGYSLQFAQSQNASLRWDALFPAHRQYTNYKGVGE